MIIYWLAFSAFALIAFSGLLYLQARIVRQEHDMLALKRDLRTLTGNLSAQCNSGAGMNRRLNGIEAEMRQRQEQLEQLQRQETEREYERDQRSTNEQPYGEAIYLVHQGAGAQRLMDELGLSRHEAELLCRVHGMRSAA
jgi:hypothetical protein